MANLEVLLFAVARELAGADSIIVEIEMPATAAEVMAVIGAAAPALLPLLASCRLAVNQQYVGDDQVISEMAEAALIPPVSGG